MIDRIAVDGHNGGSVCPPDRVKKLRERVKRLRDKSFSWSQIVDVLALDHRANPLRLYRLAHERSGSSVVDEVNQLDSAVNAALRVQRLYDYEMWPGSGRRPTVRVLLVLAQIYQTAARRLITESVYASYTAGDQADIEAADFSYLDPHHPRRPLTLSRVDEESAEPFVPSTTPRGDGEGPPRDDVVDRLVDAGHGESFELFRTVTRMSSDPRRRETLFQLALVLGGVSGLPLVSKLNPEDQERLARATLSPRNVDAEVVATFELVTKVARRLYDHRGPEAVLKAVVRFRAVVAELLDDLARPMLRERLVRIYGELSQLAGWLLYDLTLFPAADRCFQEGLIASQEAKDIPMTTFIHCCLGQMAAFRKRIPTAIDHAFAARGWAGRSGNARLACYAEQTAAWAFAMEKNTLLTSRALNRVEELTPDQSCDVDSGFLSFIDQSLTLGNRAHCWLHLDRPELAQRAAEDGVALTPPAFPRNRGFRLVDAAMALVLRKEIEEGVKLAEQVANIAVGQNSIRLAQWLREVRRRMEPWANVPDVHHLDQRILALGLESEPGPQ